MDSESLAVELRVLIFGSELEKLQAADI